MSQSAQFIKTTAQRPNIRLIIVRFLRTQLWREVIRRTHNGICHNIGLIEHFCDTKIADFYLVVLAEEHVDCFYVAVQDFV
jgi:hypothetical protein